MGPGPVGNVAARRNAGPSRAGTLTGTLEIDYRILVEGPCGAPIGTYDEHWIAHGSFVGMVNGSSTSARLSYVARVAAGGRVVGTIVLGQGLSGTLRVRGSFSDGQLSYDGEVERDA